VYVCYVCVCYVCVRARVYACVLCVCVRARVCVMCMNLFLLAVSLSGGPLIGPATGLLSLILRTGC
jgi:hypothetical protein